MKRNNSGFTMVELLVTVAVSFIVLSAAAALLLLGLRVHKTTQKEAEEQQTVRIVLSALEELSASGKIYRVEPLSDGWQLQGKDSSGAAGAVLLRYNNGKLRSAELLLREDGSVKLIRRAETAADYFATFDFANFNYDL